MPATVVPARDFEATTRPARPSRTQARRPAGARPVNVGPNERLFSALGGGLLALYGLSRGNLPGLGLAAVGGALLYRGATGHCDVYEALGINTARRRAPATSVEAGAGVKVEERFTVDKPAAELFAFWRNFENLPRVMRHLESVRCTGGNRSHWVARGPLGYRAEWDAEVHNERDNELIAWRSLEGSPVDTAGSVHFTPAPGGRGTEVRIVLKYDPPAGKLGAYLSALFGADAAAQIREDLRSFKQLMEAGEVATTQGQPTGKCGMGMW